MFIAGACNGGRTNYSVKVQVKSPGAGYLYLARLTLSGSEIVDSVLPDKSGNYEFKGYTEFPDFYIVYRTPQKFINLIIQPGDDFRVFTEEASFDENYIIEGSKDSRLIQKMVNEQIRTLEKITAISTEYENSLESPEYASIKIRIDSTYDKIMEQHRQFSLALISENPKSLASLMALYQQLGRNSAVFDYKKDFRVYATVDSNLIGIYPRSEAVMDLDRKVTELRKLLKLEIGATVPEISLPDPQGKTISLSSLKNKFTLLVFWASWSDESNREIKNLNSLYPKLSRFDLEYYQVSLDRTRDSWLKAITDLRARGTHVSDLMYWNSPVVEVFQIEKLPVLYLIDGKGNIRAKNFNSGELSEILEGISQP
jgi:alkyl hydroperoxide reductase subunit AhpC